MSFFRIILLVGFVYLTTFTTSEIVYQPIVVPPVNHSNYNIVSTTRKRDIRRTSMASNPFNVIDFGAVPNDGSDDAPAIQSAVDACAKQSGSRLIFAPGTYDLQGERKNLLRRHKPSVTIKGLHDVIIDGNGAELVGHDMAQMLIFYECSSISIRNFKVDWDPLPFTGGKVIATGDKYFDLEVIEPHTARAGVVIQGILGYDPKAKRLALRGIDHYQRWEDEKLTEVIRPGVMRVFVSHARGVPTVGSYVIARHQIYSMNPFTFYECENVHVENVTIYTAPGMGLYASQCKDFAFKNFNVQIKPGSGRWMTTEADATHFNNCRGQISFEDCFFEGMGDDATNVHCMYNVISERIDERTVKLVQGRGGGLPVLPKEGDHLEIGGGDNPLVPYTTAIVASVSRDKGTKSGIIQFTEALPDQTAKGHVIANASTAPSVRIKRCTVRRNRARGMLIQTRDVIIEDCDFEDVSGAALHITSDANYWWEGFGVRDVIIRNNRFRNCNFGAARRSAVIDVFAEVGKSLAGAGVHQNIIIENNIISDADGAAVHIGSTDGAIIRNNTVTDPKGPAIIIANSRNIEVTGNRLTENSVAVKLEKGCDESTFKLQKIWNLPND